MWDASPVLIKMPKVLFVDDGPGKPEGINHFIGRRPIFAFGNSDGDKEMLEWTAAGDGLRFMGIVHHTDAEREYAYDRELQCRQARQGARRGRRQGLDDRRHEERLEDDLPAGDGQPLRPKLHPGKWMAGTSPAMTISEAACYFLVQWPNSAKDDGRAGDAAGERAVLKRDRRVPGLLFLMAVQEDVLVGVELMPSMSSVSPFSPMASSGQLLLVDIDAR